MIDPLREWLHGRVRDLVSSLDAGVSVNGEERKKRNGEIAVLKVSSVSSMAFNPSECKPVVDEDIDRVKESPKKNHIIVSRSNTPALVGASALVRRDFPELFLSDKLWQLKLKPSRQTSPEWLALTLASRPIRTRLSHLATGTSSSMKNISKNDLLSLRIEIPLPVEQRQIAHIVQSWDRAISGTELLIAAKLEQRKGLMQQLLAGKRRFPEFGPPRKPDERVPTEWKFPKTEEVFETYSIKSQHGKRVLSVTQDQGVVPRDSLERKIHGDVDNTSAYKLVQAGDFVISLRSFQGGLSTQPIKVSSAQPIM